jgi:ADP-heptose:LPS heptosyltransferase
MTGFECPLGAHSRILAIRLDNVGDLVLLSPALRALRSHLPTASITLMTSPAGSQAAPMLPWIDDVIVEQVVWQDAAGTLPCDLKAQKALVDGLGAHGFDAAVIFTTWSQSPWPAAYVCYLAGIPLRAGESKEFGGSLLTHQPACLPDEVHQVDRNLHLLDTLGIPDAGHHLELAVPFPATTRANQLLLDSGIDPAESFVVIAPGASCAARRYPVERFCDVATGLHAESGLPLIIVGSQRDAERMGPGLQPLTQTGAVSLVGKTTLAEVAAILSVAALVIANDSGPMHLADAFSRPQVVLYSGTEYESQWAPRSSPLRLLRRSTPCSPCYRFDCPYGVECLDIPPAEVIEHALDLLGSPVPGAGLEEACDR